MELDAAHRYELHSKQLFTKADGAKLEAEIIKTIATSKHWTLTAMFAGLAAIATINKLF